MDFTAATEKIQRFFGLDGADDEVVVNDTQNTYQAPEEPKASAPRQPLRSQMSEPVKKQEAYTNTPTIENRRQSSHEARPQMQNERVQPKQDNVLRMKQSAQSSAGPKVKDDSQVKKVLILEPRTYTEAKTIAKAIFRSEVVIINFRVMEEAQARRIVDFLTGVVYALDGDIQRLGDELFICTPPNMEIDSDVAKSLLKTQFTEF